MLNGLFMERIWIPIGIWVLVYTSDFILTMIGARLYSSGANKHFDYSGGYELNPYFPKDVARLQWFTFNFFLALALYGGLLVVCSTGPRELFALAWGFLIFPQLYIHMRHVRNLVFFYHVKRSDGVEGKVRVAHWLSLRSTAAEWISFGALLLFTYGITASLPVAGGTIACVLYGIRYMQRSGRSRKSQQASNLASGSPLRENVPSR
jgi:hypothetical protein